MDKRIERTRREVLGAAIALLGERGYAAFNMEAVASKAGVSKSTLYRHWPTKLSLIADALETLNVQPKPGPVDGDIRQRVTMLLCHLAEALTASPFAACMPGLIEAAKHHAEVAHFLHEYSAHRRETLVALLRDAVAAGELPVDFDAETAALALSGAIFYRRLMTPKPYLSEEMPALVAAILGSAVSAE
ncbi:TetR/AcrR family transcriptional regulator [Nitratireductor sp. ZSWI3]|uniref:TetR/AcrR family transcriptional regulator n=1 Tax=Nitratireductor sp. ZSWI3 TaxID=2966359 RepID=UPI0021503CAE|nr:TetR/AcrR family transcriptional regulator [Nitratireductor sp. ZSWI3]MCR4267831.1 TetR/AcrR family transcriptional regulator [Nitratireductor sp. ZSWI3]